MDDSLCFCHITLEQDKHLARRAACMFKHMICNQVMTDFEETLSVREIFMLLNFFKCNGPKLSRYKQRRLKFSYQS